MLTRNDVKELKTIFATKEDLDNRTNSIINEIKTVIEMIGEFIGKTKNQEEILDTHEHRLDKLEDKVFSTN